MTWLWIIKTELNEKFGAGNETRTRDPDLGKVVLYQLSYSRVAVMRYKEQRITFIFFISIATNFCDQSLNYSRNWSGKRDSNSRPRPWQGRALPTELFPLWVRFSGTESVFTSLRILHRYGVRIIREIRFAASP